MLDRLPVHSFPPRPADRRKPLTPKQRDQLLKDHNRICCECKGRIETWQRWQDEHLLALNLGGSNAWDNRAPIHTGECLKAKNDRDAALIAKGRRIRGETCTKPRGRPIQNRGFEKRREPYKWPKQKFSNRMKTR